MISFNEYQERLIASAIKRFNYAAPEQRAEIVHQLAEDLLGSERKRLGKLLAAAVVETGDHGSLLAFAARCKVGAL